MRYDPNNEVCAHCSDHYFDGKGMYVDCEGKYCEEARLDIIGLETSEETPAGVLYKQDAARYQRELEAINYLKAADPDLYRYLERMDGVYMLPDGDGAMDIKLLDWYKDAAAFNCKATEDFKDLTPEEEAEAQRLEDPDERLIPREKDHAQAQDAGNKIHRRPSGVSGGGHVIKPGVSGQPSTDPMLNFGITSEQLEDHFKKYPSISAGPGIRIPVTIKSADPVPGEDEILKKLADNLNKQATTGRKLK